MKFNQDETGRYPLSGKEYIALRSLYGALNVLAEYRKDLKDRADLTEGTWDDLETAMDLICRVFANILNTIPYKKLDMLEKEMHETYLSVSIKRPYLNPNDRGCYIDSKILMRLINLCIQDHCFLCEKSYKEGTRHCEIYKAIQDCYQYQFDSDDGRCPLAEVMSVEEAAAHEI